MAYQNLEICCPSDNGTYIVQVLTLQGHIREAKATWEARKGFNLVANPLKSGEFIKAWWQF